MVDRLSYLGVTWGGNMAPWSRSSGVLKHCRIELDRRKTSDFAEHAFGASNKLFVAYFVDV